MRVRELMSTPAISVLGEAPVSEALQLLDRNQITAMPVVDRQGRLVGVISEADLIPDALLVLDRVPSYPMRLSAGYLGFVAVVSLPWILPAVLRGGGLASDPAGVDAFASGADSRLGVAGSLVTLGGVWNAAVVPPERSSLLLVVVVLVAVVAALVAGVPSLLARPGGAGLVAGGVLGLVLAAMGATAGGAALLRWIVVAVRPEPAGVVCRRPGSAPVGRRTRGRGHAQVHYPVTEYVLSLCTPSDWFRLFTIVNK